MKNYLVLDFQVSPVEPGRDILLALLDNLGYDSFEESPKGLKAYILEEDFNAEELEALPLFNGEEFEISYSSEKLETINWNEEWERNYEPVSLEQRLLIRAPFHSISGSYDHEIVIEPKMSFGTGHHHTTRLMAKAMFDLDFKGKKVLDMGTGTGILAILAQQLGATDIDAIDNFEWAVENTAENAERNQADKVKAEWGDAALLTGRNYDMILANINRNVLLEDMKAYVDTLASGGSILFSGFFAHDFELIDEEAQNQGLEFRHRIEEERWQCVHYQKP
ncbi:50S ribosomal protein L11 methyltransferase [Croceimicrobium sp.]|uniref:50S ribosomal protein L11 methyltransferase n=1 Tax=Croceimicrobium sp. TaxID=2828340 RepID=UPI003BAA0C2A